MQISTEPSPQRNVAFDPNFQREAAAYHEAGHAVIAIHYGWWINDEGVEIDNRWYCGMECLERDNTTRHSVGVSLAGRLAESKFHGRGRSPEDGDLIDVIDTIRFGWIWIDDDLSDDTHAMQRLIEDDPNATHEELIARYRKYEAEVMTELNDSAVWAEVESVAQELLKHGRLTAEQVNDAVDATVEFDG